jgi:hypothetical protein
MAHGTYSLQQRLQNFVSQYELLFITLYPYRHLLVFSKEESNEQIVLTPRETIKFKILR